MNPSYLIAFLDRAQTCNLIGGLANFTHLVVLLFHEGTGKSPNDEFGGDDDDDDDCDSNYDNDDNYNDGDSADDYDYGGTDGDGRKYLLPIATTPFTRTIDMKGVTPTLAPMFASPVSCHHKSLVSINGFSPGTPPPSLPAQHQGSTTPNRRSKQR